jgi:uncharacterized phage protein gp47/JayE
VTIPKGTKVASIPGQKEKPQTFETDADLEARVEWNELRPLQTRTPPTVNSATTTITVKGTSTTAKPGDLVLVYLQPAALPNHWLYARVAGVTRDTTVPDATRTYIALESPVKVLPAPTALQSASFTNTVVVLGQRAAAFGATAPDLSLMSNEVRENQKATPQSIPTPPLPTEWLNLKMPTGSTTGGIVDLDAVYPDAVGGRLVVFNRGNGTAALTQMGLINSATETGRRGFGLSARVTRIDVTGIDLLTATGFVNSVRETAIYLETGREELLVVDDDVQMPASTPDRLVVLGAVSLPVSRRVVLSGEQWTTIPGTPLRIAEVATLKSSTPVSTAPVGSPQTELVFDRQLVSRFRSTTLTVLANAVGASHGETPASGAEVIGSGAAARLSPRFPLKRSPLTYVPSANARGYAPAIEVRVNDRLYTETPSLFERDDERVYTVRTERGDLSEVQFAGRLPSSLHTPQNVTALYRTGGGTAGNLPAGRLTMLMTPILGVGKVTNVVPADGASDAETLDDMRTAAPQSIRTLDRVVSLGDFEAFARARRGVGKALATELHVGMRSVVCLTIATTDILSPAPGSDVIESLRDALALVTMPGRSIRIEGFTDLTAQVTVALVVDAAFRRADVEAAVRTALGAKFGRAVRSFGRALHKSEVLAALHDVKGVVAGRLAVFQLSGSGQLPDGEGRLLCPGPTPAGQLAGLLSIDANQVQFTEMLP